MQNDLSAKLIIGMNIIAGILNIVLGIISGCIPRILLGIAFWIISYQTYENYTMRIELFDLIDEQNSFIDELFDEI